MTDAAEEMLDEEVTQGEVEDESDLIREAFDQSITEELEEDFIKLSMVSAGATFKSVTRLYNQYMIDAGLAISKADRNQIIDDVMEDRDVELEEDFNDAVEALVDSMQGATERSAAAQIRSFSKRTETSCFVKPKSESSGAGRGGFVKDWHEWLCANKQCTKEEALAYINGDGDHPDTSANTKKHTSHYIKSWYLTTAVYNDTVQELQSKAA